MLFDKTGKVNTDNTRNAAFSRARQARISELVVAASSGETACKARALSV
jgi:hypothetical protein